MTLRSDESRANATPTLQATLGRYRIRARAIWSAKGSEGLIRSNGGPRGGTSCGPEGWTSQGGAAGARTHEGAATDMVTAPCVLKKKSPGVGLLSHELPRSIIGDGGLNFRVRNGIGCTPSSMDARTDSLVTVREGWLCSRRHFVRDRNRIK